MREYTLSTTCESRARGMDGAQRGRQQGKIGCLGILVLLLVFGWLADKCSWFDPRQSSYRPPFERDAECSSLRHQISDLNSRMTAILECADGLANKCDGIDARRTRSEMSNLLNLSSPALLNRCESKGYMNIRRDGQALASKAREAAAALAAVESARGEVERLRHEVGQVGVESRTSDLCEAGRNHRANMASTEASLEDAIRHCQQPTNKVECGIEMTDEIWASISQPIEAMDLPESALVLESSDRACGTQLVQRQAHIRQLLSELRTLVGR